jgi:hypothetical protein
MKGEAVIYKTDGTREVLKFDKPIALEVLNKAVGGYIETVPYWNEHLGRKCVAFCNEEGKIKSLPFNGKADLLWHLERQAYVDDHLFGDVIVIMGDDEFMEAL